MLTGEPDAGNLHVRFGGRGGANQCAIPTPYQGATLRAPFRDFPAVGFVRDRTSSSLLNPSGLWRDAHVPLPALLFKIPFSAPKPMAVFLCSSARAPLSVVASDCFIRACRSFSL